MQDISVLYLSKVSLIPGAGYRAHTHDYWHFTLILRGASQFDDGSALPHLPFCKCSPANAISPGAVCTEERHSINVMFLVHDKRLHRKLDTFPFHSLREEGLHIPVLMNIIEQARDLNPGQDFIDFAFGYYLHLLFATHTPAPGVSHTADLTEQALTYIEDNYMRQIRIEDIANHIGCTVSNISHVLKKTTGMTAVDHIREVRIKHACRLLAYSNIPIDEVISSCGYISASYFHKEFKQKVGTTPNRYRTSHVGNNTFYHGEEAALDVPYLGEIYTYIPGARKCIHWRTPREYLNQEIK